MAIDTDDPQKKPPFEGEDLETLRWEDARFWLSVYADLLDFKRGVLDRVKVGLTRLQPVAQDAAKVDLEIIESQMDGYQARIELWYQRVWELQGLWIDPEGQVLRYRGREAELTDREAQLLQFLMDHPHRFFTVDQILNRAWAGPDLFPEQVRNYVTRVRKILVRLEIPCELINRPGHGYSLVFSSDEQVPVRRRQPKREP